MKEAEQVQVPGPLAAYAERYRRELKQAGYSRFTTSAHLYLMAHLSRWLAARRLGADALTPERVDHYLRDRRASGHVRRLTPRGLAPLLGHLRGLGVAPEPTPPPAEGAHALLLEQFADYLLRERGLAERTVLGYLRFARLFLAGLPAAGEDGGTLHELGPDAINAFVLRECRRRSAGSAANAVTALRALLRFCYLEGHLARPLAGAVPAAAGWRDTGATRALTQDQVSRLLASCDRRTHAGRRDLAILTVLARLGLRAGEVAALGLDDVDWRAGEILVLGKGNRRERLPLPADVGQALADYCRGARPRNSCRRLFLQVRAPYGALTGWDVSAIVSRAGARAGLGRMGAHRLRHSAATALLAAGAPLAEIGQVLRHRHHSTTARYARADRDALAALARPWPGQAP